MPGRDVRLPALRGLVAAGNSIANQQHRSPTMIERLYVHNFRCLENFELVTKGLPTALLIGPNGSGKSSVRRVLELLQILGRGTNRVGELVRPEDFAHGARMSRYE